ncbi:MAG TPA: condensation domain-containing protein, partial [Micromonosporaceae bacterium]|nr:condensation domain-containing protein [Micromonosporaceae bacterium]
MTETDLHGAPGAPSESRDRAAGLSDVKRALLERRMRERAAVADEPPLVPVRRDGRLAVSYQQEGMWFLDQLNADSVVYHVPLVVRLVGPLDVPRLRRGIEALLARHESLRTRFGSGDGVPFQVIEPPGELDLPVTDLTGAADPMGAAVGIAEQEAARPFDLAVGPLVRCFLMRLADAEHMLVIAMHHIVVDGWSVSVLVKELADLYADPDVVLPDLALQPADVAAWQRTWLSGATLAAQLGYWRERLAGAPLVDFPTDRPRPAVRTWEGATVLGRLEAELCGRARGFARAQQSSFLATLMSAFAIVLAHHTRQDDFSIGSVFSGRSRPELEPLIGYFANTLVLRIDAGGDPTFRELVQRANDVVLGAVEHQDVPFTMVVDALRPPRDPTRNPLFQVSMSLQPSSVAGGQFELAGTQAIPVTFDSTRSRFDVSLTLAERGAGAIEMTLEYSTELFDRDRMQLLAEHFGRVLDQVIAEPGLRMSQVTLTTPTQRAELLDRFNGARREVAPTTLGELFARQARATPEAVALVAGAQELTYVELDRRAERVAHLLRDAGAGPGTFVAICMPRGVDLITAILAVLKAGAAYLVIDPEHPPMRIAGILEDAAPVAALTHEATDGRLGAAPARRIRIDDADLLAAAPDGPVGPTAGPEDLAYVLYTSGSTGTPKGVLIEHRNVVNFITSVQELFDLTPTDRILGFAAHTFDVSVFETFAALLTGARLHLALDHERVDPAQLQALLERGEITVTDLPPSVMALLEPERLPALRIVFVGGEAFGGELVNRWNPNRRFFNGYGPTECT